MNLDQIFILQNKVDLYLNDPAVITQQAKDIERFTKGTIAEGAPIIPISAQHGYNIDAVIDYLCRIPQPVRDLQSPP